LVVAATSTVALDDGASLTVERLVLPLPLLPWTMERLLPLPLLPWSLLPLPLLQLPLLPWTLLPLPLPWTMEQLLVLPLLCSPSALVVAATSTVALDDGAPSTMERMLPLPLLPWTLLPLPLPWTMERLLVLPLLCLPSALVVAATSTVAVLDKRAPSTMERLALLP
jgi:hypothetical protein